MDNEFKVSDTQLEAEWIKDTVIFYKVYRCSNCKNPHSIERSTRLTPYCGNCGAKMKNPQYIMVEYDYGY